jgi:hypothetical protein
MTIFRAILLDTGSPASEALRAHDAPKSRGQGLGRRLYLKEFIPYLQTTRQTIPDKKIIFPLTVFEKLRSLR